MTERRSDDWFSHILEEFPQETTLTVQIYGALIILDISTLLVTITHVSENLFAICGLSIAEALQHPLADLCDVSQWSALMEEAKAKWLSKGDDIYSYKRVFFRNGYEIWMIMHANGSSIVCELLPIITDELNSQEFLDEKIQQLHTLLSKQTDSIFRTAQVATNFINDVLGFDRCVLYRFAPFPHFGEIIAETFINHNPNKLVPFLGLRFPPQSFTDDMIKLYKKIKIRMVAEVFDSTSLIISKSRIHAHLSSVSSLESPVGGNAIYAQDLLLHSVLRGATAEHEEQLIAMGVRNCMTAVLVVNGFLWGAIQCINIYVKPYSWSHRMFLVRAVELLSTFISTTLLNIEMQENQLIDHYCRHIAVVNSKVNQCFLIEALLNCKPDLFEMVQFDIGIACFTGTSFARIGPSPSVNHMKCLIEWMASPDFANRPDTCRLSRVTHQAVLQHLNLIKWSNRLSSIMSEVLSKDWQSDPNVIFCCWESFPAHLIPRFELESAEMVEGVLGALWLNADKSKRCGFFFFRELSENNDRALQHLSSSILSNSLVADTMERYTSRWGKQNKSPGGPWSSRKLVIFHLLISVFNTNIKTRDPLEDIHRLRQTAHTRIQLQELTILNNPQAQVVFRKEEIINTTGIINWQYYCLTVNEEYTSIFGPLFALSPVASNADDDWEETEWDVKAIDLSQWCSNVGLDISTICCDGKLVVKKQSLWSKTKGHIKATLQGRFLYGVDHGNTIESLFALDIRDDSMSSRVENALIYSHDQLKKSERMKQELVGTVSHELRTPLTAIMGFHELLSRGLQESNAITPDIQQSLNSISSASVHLLDIVTNLLDLSKYEMTNKKQTKVDLITIAQEACRWVHSAAEKNGIKLSLEILSAISSPVSSSRITSSRSSRDIGRSSLRGDPKYEADFVPLALEGLELTDNYLHEPPMEVFGDVVGLKRVFVNLLDNAIKFSPRDTTIRVSLRWIPSISSLDECGYINVVIEDQGIGIATENLSNIFRPFFQVNLGSNREQKGAGLGLSIVRQIVELHKGRISVSSKLGQGTRFDITIPSYNSQSPLQRERSLLQSVISPLEADQHPVLGITQLAPQIPQSVQLDTDMLQYITLPLNVTNASAINTPLPTTRRLERAKTIIPANFDSSSCLMIVDDNKINRRVLHRMLSLIGYSNIVEAENGQEGLHAVETLFAAQNTSSSKPPISLMFLDIQMPILDGPATAQSLRDRGFTFPIIAFSASSNWTESISTTTRSLFDGFLAKPINSETLHTILEENIKV